MRNKWQIEKEKIEKTEGKITYLSMETTFDERQPMILQAEERFVTVEIVDQNDGIDVLYSTHSAGA